MPPLTGDRPAEAFRQFQDHIGRLLNCTVTDAPLSLIHPKDKPYATVTFRDEAEIATAVPLFASRLLLYLSQSLRVEHQTDGTWKLRTMTYAYHILEGREQDSRWLVRWEYTSRDQREMKHPRHHVHLPVLLETPDGNLDLDALHLSTGWVTIEEIIRFLIVEVGVKPKSTDWNADLFASEEKFKEWTSRTI